MKKMTKRRMYKEMRKILRYVESGGNPNIATTQESDLWGECCVRGFLSTSPDSGKDELGIWHVILLNHNITPAGIEWLYAPSANLKSTISVLISVAALLVSILSSWDEIADGIFSVLALLGFA